MKKDHDIWERIKNGDKSALSEVYSQYFDNMFQYGIRFRNEPEFVKDCIQDVFFKVIRAGRHLGSTESIQFYLLKALKNTIYKKITSKKLKVDDHELMVFKGYFSLEDEILENEITHQKQYLLKNALKGLSARQREIIYLRYECNMEYDSICKIMDLKNDSARKLLYRAIKLLREIIVNQVKL